MQENRVSSQGGLRDMSPSSHRILVLIAIGMTIIGLNDLTPIYNLYGDGFLLSLSCPCAIVCDFTTMMITPLFVGLLASAALLQRVHARIIVEIMFLFVISYVMTVIGIALFFPRSVGPNAPPIPGAYISHIIQWVIICALIWRVRHDIEAHVSPQTSVHTMQKVWMPGQQSFTQSRQDLMARDRIVAYVLIAILMCMGVVSLCVFWVQQNILLIESLFPMDKHSGLFIYDLGNYCVIDFVVAGGRFFVGYIGIRSIRYPTQAPILVGIILMFAVAHIVGIALFAVTHEIELNRLNDLVDLSQMDTMFYDVSRLNYEVFNNDALRMVYLFEFVMYASIIAGYVWLWRQMEYKLS